MTWPKRLLPAALFAALLAAVPQAPNTVKELAPGVWVRMGDRARNQPANTSWVLFKDYIVVIDANFPWGAREILPEIRKTSSKPIRYVFNSTRTITETTRMAAVCSPIRARQSSAVRSAPMSTSRKGSRHGIRTTRRATIA